MMSIGRFADATGLTVKALRHYDEIGLLTPAQVDPETAYRYYEPAQVEDAVTIPGCGRSSCRSTRFARSCGPTPTRFGLASPRTATTWRRRRTTSRCC
jgi:hypothetical protein